MARGERGEGARLGIFDRWWEGDVLLPESPESVVFDLTVSSADRQIQTFRDLRTRAGTVFSAAAVTTGFLGAQALSGDRPLNTLGWFAVVAFAVGGLLTLAIFWPWPWTSALDPNIMLEDIKTERWTQTDIQRFLAPVIDENVNSNQVTLKRLFWLFRASCLALIIEVILWLALLASQ